MVVLVDAVDTELAAVVGAEAMVVDPKMLTVAASIGMTSVDAKPLKDRY